MFQVFPSFKCCLLGAVPTLFYVLGKTLAAASFLWESKEHVIMCHIFPRSEYYFEYLLYCGIALRLKSVFTYWFSLPQEISQLVK